MRVTKSWVSREVRSNDSRKEPQAVRKFMTTRVSEGRMSALRDREVACGPDGKPVAWASSTRVESRERLLGLVVKYALEEGGEPILTPVGGNAPYLACVLPENPTAAQAGWSLENGNGWVTEREAA